MSALKKSMCSVPYGFVYTPSPTANHIIRAPKGWLFAGKPKLFGAHYRETYTFLAMGQHESKVWSCAYTLRKV